MSVIILFTALSIIFASANLVCIVFFYQKPAQIFTKIAIMPLLTIYYTLSAKEFLWTAAVAAFSGWLGDIFLAKKRAKVFTFCGIAAFFAGNLCYVASILRYGHSNEASFEAVSAAPLALLFAFAMFAVLTLFMHAPRGLAAAASLYSLTLFALIAFSAKLFAFRGDYACAIVLAGAVFLCISDAILARSYMSQITRYANFFIMLFYIAAQFCLLSGLAGL
jgi:hypothetical protein